MSNESNVYSFSWCNEEGHSHLNIKLYKAPETVKKVYTDEELMILIKKPEKLNQQIRSMIERVVVHE